ncbi:MAG: hypothetical protein LUH20_08935 [Lachnospiraceae bacterium]|nr:hypothetical protein [Lachnospiraceae bacterium]
MKKKINICLISTVFVTLVATLLIAVAIFRNMYKEQVLSEMRIYAALIGSLSDSAGELEAQYTEDVAGLRITLIDEGGDVVYDSDVSGTMENHADREEVKEAEAEGKAGRFAILTLWTVRCIIMRCSWKTARFCESAGRKPVSGGFLRVR